MNIPELPNGVYLETIDYEEEFRALSQPPIFANDFDLDSKEDRERLNGLLYNKLEGDTLSNIPSCDCGKLRGARHYGRRHEKTATDPDACGSQVLHITEKPLESIIWMRTPDRVDRFVNLQVWRILKKALTHSGYSILDWLTNPQYQATVKTPPIMEKVQGLGLPRGLNNFYRNYDYIIDTLYKAKVFVGRVPVRARTYEYLKMVRKRTFTRQLPFPSKLTFVTEESNKTMFADPKMFNAVNGVLTLISAESRGEDKSTEFKESRCVQTMNNLVEYNKEFESGVAATKKGIFRKLIYGTPPHWSYRSVISSLHEPHHYNSIKLPWSLSVLLFKAHLSNKLLKRGYTPNEIIALLYENTLRYHFLLDSLFKELIAESPYEHGIPTTFGRNPTLKRGSIELEYIDEIKTDPTINTISKSVLALKAKNADYDGDALNGQLPIDNRMADALMPMEAHTGVMDPNRPFRVSSNITLPTTIVSSIGDWLTEGDEMYSY